MRLDMLNANLITFELHRHYKIPMLLCPSGTMLNNRRGIIT